MAEKTQGKLYDKYSAIHAKEMHYWDEENAVTKLFNKAKAEAPIREKMMKREDLGNGLARYSLDVAEQNKKWSEWFEKWFGSPDTNP